MGRTKWQNPFSKKYYPHYLCASDVIPSAVEGCNKEQSQKAFSTALELTKTVSLKVEGCVPLLSICHSARLLSEVEA